MSKNDHLSAKLCYTIPKLIVQRKESHLAWPTPNTLSKMGRKEGVYICQNGIKKK